MNDSDCSQDNCSILIIAVVLPDRVFQVEFLILSPNSSTRMPHAQIGQKQPRGWGICCPMECRWARMAVGRDRVDWCQDSATIRHALEQQHLALGPSANSGTASVSSASSSCTSTMVSSSSRFVGVSASRTFPTRTSPRDNILFRMFVMF